MEAKDLRIGNYIEYDNNYFKMYSIAEDQPFLDTMEFGVNVLDWKDIKPIPLDEKWLIEFGFLLEPWGWHKDGFLIRCSKLGNQVFWMEFGNGKRVEFPYVHTLQNFFALTNKELIRKA